MMHLLFGADRRFLGEVSTERGKLQQCLLTQEGEIALGGLCESWQTSGVPLKRQITGPSAHDRFHAYFIEKIQPRSPRFQSALEPWAQEQGLFAFDLPDSHVGCWELVLGLPLAPSEQFALFVALRRSAVPLLPLWRSCLEEARLLAHYERRETRKNVALLQRRLSARLFAPMKKP